MGNQDRRRTVKVLVIAAAITAIAVALLGSPMIKEIPILVPLAIFTVFLCFLMILLSLLYTPVLLANIVSRATQDRTCVPDANINTWNGPTMKSVGVLILIDVPDDVRPEKVAEMMPGVVDSGFEIFDGSGTQTWELSRMFVLSEEEFTRCLAKD